MTQSDTVDWIDQSYGFVHTDLDSLLKVLFVLHTLVQPAKSTVFPGQSVVHLFIEFSSSSPILMCRGRYTSQGAGL